MQFSCAGCGCRLSRDEDSCPACGRVDPTPTQEHESTLRLMVAHAQGHAYRSLRSLAEAREVTDATLVFEGDYGGTIYLTCPVWQIACSEATLRSLLEDIDARYWREPNGAGLYFEVFPVGRRVPGGVGGGLVLEDVWVHPRLDQKGISAGDIADVVHGKRPRL